MDYSFICRIEALTVEAVNGMFLAFLVGRGETSIYVSVLPDCVSPPIAFYIVYCFYWYGSGAILCWVAAKLRMLLKLNFKVYILSALLCNFRFWLKCCNAGEMSKNNTL